MKKLFPRQAGRLLTGTLALAFAVSASVVAQHGDVAGPAPKLTAQQWQADVRFLGEELPRRHRNAFHRMRREDFEAAVQSLHDRVPSMSEDEILVGMMRVVAMVKDGHTSLFPRGYFRTGLYPVRLYLFSDGLFVRQAAPAYAEIVGARVLKIGDASAEEAVRAAMQVVPADNEMGARALAPVALTIPEVLAGLKINTDKQRLRLTVAAGGKERVVEVQPAGTFESMFRPTPADWVDAARGTQTPLYLKDRNNLYWFEYVKDRRLVYVQQNGVANKEGGEPVGDFYRRVFEFVEANPVEKLVLDLRHNGGGNNTLNRQVVVGLIRSKVNRRGQLFVITGRETFSAAQNLVNQIEKYTEAIFIGEPTAGHPNHYGDNRPFTLPNSKLIVRASTLWWQDLDPRDERQWTAPEIAAELSSEDYRAGRDPALQAALEYAPGSALSEMIDAAKSQRTLAEFLPNYRAYKASAKSKYVSTEAAMNSFGYWLLERRRVADATTVFELNVAAYPASANVYDSLGDALEAAGRKEEAVKSFEKALSIDPNYPSSLAALRRLKGNQ